jgi:hypothetical protein
MSHDFNSILLPNNILLFLNTHTTEYNFPYVISAISFPQAISQRKKFERRNL